MSADELLTMLGLEPDALNISQNSGRALITLTMRNGSVFQHELSDEELVVDGELAFRRAYQWLAVKAKAAADA